MLCAIIVVGVMKSSGNIWLGWVRQEIRPEFWCRTSWKASTRRWEDNIKMDLKDMGCQKRMCMELAQNRVK